MQTDCAWTILLATGKTRANLARLAHTCGGSRPSHSLVCPEGYRPLAGESPIETMAWQPRDRLPVLLGEPRC
jgi:hypothetical protein